MQRLTSIKAATHEYAYKIRERWHQLAAREKRALIMGGSVLGIFLLYAIIWSPLMNKVAMLREEIIHQQKTLSFMQAAERVLSKQTRNDQKPRSILAVMADLQKEITHAGLDKSLKELKQSTSENIEMHFQAVEFDKLMMLLVTSAKQQHFSIEQMSANTVNTPGLVNIDMLLKWQ